MSVGNHSAAVDACFGATTVVYRAILIEYGAFYINSSALLIEYRVYMSVSNHSALGDA